MNGRPRSSTFLRVSLLAIACVCGVAQAARAAEPAECVREYDASQRSRQAGKLRAAKASLLVCAQIDCPAAVVRDCTRWLAEVTASMPTVVLGARDANRRDLRDIRVRVGGETIAEQLSGQATPLDPGQATFEFQDAAGVLVTTTAILREGEKNRAIVVDFPPPRPASPPAPLASPPTAASNRDDHPIPVAPLILAGVGVLGLGSFTYFGLDARSDLADMRGSCAPHCPQSYVDRAHRKALVADISLGVSLAAFAAGGLLLYHTPAATHSAGMTHLHLGAGTLSVAGSF